jgi:hypothetical protein
MNKEQIKKLVTARITTFDALLKNPKTLKRNRIKYDAARVTLALLLRDIEFVDSTTTGE